jgi:glucose-1-phosphate cytidylyltransferase
MNNDFTIELGQPEKLCFHHGHEENGWRITLADTGEKTLKGGRLKRVQKYLDDEIFMMTYGDGVADVDLGVLLAFHIAHGKIATVTGINPASRFGEMKVEGSRVKAFYEKPENNLQVINGGFFVFNRAIFDFLTTDKDCDLENGALEKIASEGQLMVFKHTGFWACMDTLRDMDYLNNLWNENKAEWKIW